MNRRRVAWLIATGLILAVVFGGIVAYPGLVVWYQLRGAAALPDAESPVIRQSGETAILSLYSFEDILVLDVGRFRLLLPGLGELFGGSATHEVPIRDQGRSSESAFNRNTLQFSFRYERGIGKGMIATRPGDVQSRTIEFIVFDGVIRVKDRSFDIVGTPGSRHVMVLYPDDSVGRLRIVETQSP